MSSGVEPYRSRVSHIANITSITSRSKPYTIKEVQDDAHELQEIGYKQVYKRKFGLLAACGFTVTVSSTWEAIMGTFGVVLSSGGTSVMLWGYIAVSIAMSLVALSLGEIASIWPTSGGQYHWVAELSPPKLKVGFSWVIAWITVIMQCILIGGTAIVPATQIIAYASLASEDYVFKRWHVSLVYWALLALYTVANIFSEKYFKPLTWSIFGVHIIGFFVIIIVMPATADKFASAKDVFGTLTNGSGWPDGVSWFVGLLGPTAGFTALEIAIHFSEEIEHPKINVPKAIIYPTIINAIATLPFIVVICFVLTDIDQLYASSYGSLSASTALWYLCTKNVGASIFINLFTTYVVFVAGAFSVGSTARTIWALARDNAVPSFLKSHNAKLDVPIPATIVSLIIPFAIGIVYIFNSTAFYGITSGIMICSYFTYLLPIALCLKARQNGIMDQAKFKLGKYGYIINGVSCAYLAMMIVFLSFPTVYPPDSKTMNYGIVLVGFGLFVSIVCYVFYGRTKYHGPVQETEVVNGIPSESGSDVVQLDALVTSKGDFFK